MSRRLELELDRRTAEWDAAMGHKQAGAMQTHGRQLASRQMTVQLAALHEQQCSIVSAQLRHASSQLGQAAECARVAQASAYSRNLRIS